MVFRKAIVAICILLFGFSGFFAPTTLVNADETKKIECKWENCIWSADFKINVGSITPGSVNQSSDTVVGTDVQTTVNNFLENIITQLIIAFWVLALLVMTIGAGFMIIYHGQDELLTRWKSIFSYGLISLVVALSAGFLVQLVSYLLYWA